MKLQYLGHTIKVILWDRPIFYSTSFCVGRISVGPTVLIFLDHKELSGTNKMPFWNWFNVNVAPNNLMLYSVGIYSEKHLCPIL